jgi:nucleoside 2-deoxyribosyltransferase
VRFYIAAPYSWRERIKEFIGELEDLGIESTTSWVNETVSIAAGSSLSDEERNRHFAEIDIQDIDRADVVVVFTIDPLGPPKPRGGRHWETGYAYGKGKEIVVVGPPENLFHFLPEVKVFSSQKLTKAYLYKRSLN